MSKLYLTTSAGHTHMTLPSTTPRDLSNELGGTIICDVPSGAAYYDLTLTSYTYGYIIDQLSAIRSSTTKYLTGVGTYKATTIRSNLICGAENESGYVNGLDRVWLIIDNSMLYLGGNGLSSTGLGLSGQPSRDKIYSPFNISSAPIMMTVDVTFYTS